LQYATRKSNLRTYIRYIPTYTYDGVVDFGAEYRLIIFYNINKLTAGFIAYWVGRECERRDAPCYVLYGLYGP